MKYENTHVCRWCLDAFKRSPEGKRMKAADGKWRRTMWPAWVYTASGRRYCDKHHAQALGYLSARRVAKLRATPPWVDHKAIAQVFAEAIRLTRETGIPHEVDHIVPLQGKTVSGLHVPWNLEPIQAGVNNRKSNKFYPARGIAEAPP